MIMVVGWCRWLLARGDELAVELVDGRCHLGLESQGGLESFAGGRVRGVGGQRLRMHSLRQEVEWARVGMQAGGGASERLLLLQAERRAREADGRLVGEEDGAKLSLEVGLDPTGWSGRWPPGARRQHARLASNWRGARLERVAARAGAPEEGTHREGELARGGGRAAGQPGEQGADCALEELVHGRRRVRDERWRDERLPLRWMEQLAFPRGLGSYWWWLARVAPVCGWRERR